MNIPWPWIAGIIDAEGSISMHYSHKIVNGYKTYARRYKLAITTKDHVIVPRISEYLNIPYGHNDRKYSIRLSANAIRKFLPHILPYLFIKRAQATLILRALNIHKSQNQYTDEQATEWDNIYHDVKKLNQVGENGLNGSCEKDHIFDWGWLAGIIDGDGSISINKHGRYTKPALKISLTNHKAVDYIADKCNTNSRIDKVRGNRRVTKSIRILPQTLEAILPNIVPHLRLKTVQSKLVLEIIRQRKHRICTKPLEQRVKLLNRTHSNDIICDDGLLVAIRDVDDTSNQPADLIIFSDEWRNNIPCFENIIANRLHRVQPQFKLRPKSCEVRIISHQDIKDFFNLFHYQGHCYASHYIGVFYHQRLIAGMSIKRPTRQKSGDWEIARMACDYRYRIYGLWSYLMSWVQKNDLISGKIVTFSDKRLMTGNVYEKMGFTIERHVKPDYYWCKDGKRYHKSALRKTKEEKQTGLTEYQLRESQGYHRIYDLGKIKWSMHI